MGNLVLIQVVTLRGADADLRARELVWQDRVPRCNEMARLPNTANPEVKGLMLYQGSGRFGCGFLTFTPHLPVSTHTFQMGTDLATSIKN